MSSLIDIYEAAGMEVSEDRTSVILRPDLQPFDIVLRVIPRTIETRPNEKEKITFDIILNDEAVFDNNTVYYIEHQGEITLPVNQVRILNKEK